MPYLVGRIRSLAIDFREAEDSAVGIEARCKRRRSGASARYERKPAVHVETCIRARRTERVERRADPGQG